MNNLLLFTNYACVIQSGLMAIPYRTMDSDCVTFRNLENERLKFARNHMLKFASLINTRWSTKGSVRKRMKKVTKINKRLTLEDVKVHKK